MRDIFCILDELLLCIDLRLQWCSALFSTKAITSSYTEAQLSSQPHHHLPETPAKLEHRPPHRSYSWHNIDVCSYSLSTKKISSATSQQTLQHRVLSSNPATPPPVQLFSPVLFLRHKQSTTLTQTIRRTTSTATTTQLLDHQTQPVHPSPPRRMCRVHDRIGHLTDLWVLPSHSMVGVSILGGVCLGVCSVPSTTANTISCWSGRREWPVQIVSILDSNWIDKIKQCHATKCSKQFGRSSIPRFKNGPWVNVCQGCNQ